ncbi:unnamed protein product [Urochloa humidicola]
MGILILSMDMSGGYSRIRRAINDVAGVENVEVYSDTGRVVVTGWAYPDEVVRRLETRLRTTVVTVSYREEAKLEISSADEDESDDGGASSSDDDGGGWNGCKRICQPQEDKPVQDPTAAMWPH